MPLPDDEPADEVGGPVEPPVDEVVPDEPEPSVGEVLPPAAVPLPAVGEPDVPVPSPVLPSGVELPVAASVPPVDPEPAPVPPVASAPPLDSVPVLVAPPFDIWVGNFELPVESLVFADRVAGASRDPAETDGEAAAGTKAAGPPAAVAFAVALAGPTEPAAALPPR